MKFNPKPFLNSQHTYIVLIIACLFVGCRAPGHIKGGEPSRLAVGMTKAEVIKALGKPENVTADGQSETLSYLLERPWWQDRPFRVRLVDGKVVSYGVIEPGDANGKAEQKK